MGVVIHTKVGENRGKTRIWLEGKKLAHAGVTPTMKWHLTTGPKSLSITLSETEPYNATSQSNVLSGSVSIRKRTKNNGQTVEYPLIEFRGDVIAQVFQKDQPIRVAVSGKRIVITPQKTEKDIQERNQRLVSKLTNKIPVAVGSAFHGGGVLDRSIHFGLKDAGIDSFVRLAVELESKYLESSLWNNPELWRSESELVCGSIEHLDCFNPNFPKLDVVIAGIPCNGASISGRSKNKIENAEDHKDVGAMFYYTLNLIVAANPSIVILENVPQFANTASMSVIRSVLSARGYDLQERIISGAEFGAIEDRERLCVVAISHGLSCFDLNNVIPLKRKEDCLGCVMEDVSLDSPMYRDRTYLEEKEKRDAMKGNSFKRQVVSAASETIGCIGAGYARVRSTEPMIAHPEKQGFYRLLTVLEHAKVKTIPAEIVDGCSNTVAHEILGQSVIYAAFYAVARALGGALSLETNGSNIEYKLAS